MSDLIRNNFANLRATYSLRSTDWPLYQSVLRHQLGQSVQPCTSQLAGRLEQAYPNHVNILSELISTYEFAPRARAFYDKYPDEKFELPDVFRFETVLRMHSELLSMRNELAKGRPISIASLKWMEGIINGAGRFSGNFGIGELAGNIKSAVDDLRSRHPSQDLQEAGRILNQIASTSAYHEANPPPLPTGFAQRLLTGGIKIFAGHESVDDALRSEWAKSIVRRQIIPDMIRSSTKQTAIPVETLLQTLTLEWTHYNEYLMRQYDEGFHEPYPDICPYEYKYEGRYEDHHAIYNETWDAYDLIYGLERAVVSLGQSNQEVLKSLSDRFSFLVQLVEEYITRLKRGEKIHTRFKTTTSRLSETPELEELFVLAATLRALDSKDAGKKAFDFICELILDVGKNDDYRDWDCKNNHRQDRGHMLWRIEELFNTTTPMGEDEYGRFCRDASAANAMAIGPPIRRNLSECDTFAERVARQWATREVHDLISRIQDIEIDVATRNMAIDRLKHWSAAAEEALPVLAQFESALPDRYDLENDALTPGANPLFAESKMKKTILKAREAHKAIQKSLAVKDWW